MRQVATALMLVVGGCRLVAGIDDRDVYREQAGGTAGTAAGASTTGGAGAAGAGAGAGGTATATGGSAGSASAGVGGGGAGAASLPQVGDIAEGLADGFTCALSAGGRVYCWGDGSSGQLGSELPRSLHPTLVPGLTGVTRVRLGRDHACAVSDGQVVCWGSNVAGQVTGTPTVAPVSPRIFKELEEVIDVAPGRAHTCALTRSGQTACWGSDEEGQLGTSLSRPTAARVVAGDDHNCLLEPSGVAHCWGASAAGQLGAPSFGPVAAAGGEPAPAFAAVSLGADHSCGVARSGQIWCWGAGSAGQLGTGEQAGSDIALPSFGTAVELGVTCGGAFSCSWSSSRVQCAGDNEHGTLGQAGPSQSSPRVVALPAAPARVAAYTSHACALLESGELWCWGDNRSGQLGTGTTADQPVTEPVLVVW